jgi:glycosyltransferase involved in cell wall biosynthesis
MQPSVLVIQMGARMRYAVPRILHSAGRLAHFHTDLAGDRGWPVLLRAIPERARPRALSRLLQRRIEGIPRHLVSAHSLLGLKIAYQERTAPGPDELAEAYIQSGHKLCRLALRRGFEGARVVGAIGTSSEPLLQAARREGKATFTEQIITPPSVEREIMEHEQADFPDWETGASPMGSSHRFEEVCRREWALTDLLVCGSEFVRQGIKQAGGPFDRCVVVPYGVTLPGHPAPRAERVSVRSLQVLTIGAVGLRKGAPYVLQAAEAMRGRAEFRWLGRVALSEFARKQMAPHVVLEGQTSRDETMRKLAAADVFLLPSVCEGSATVCYEALALGIPVITTPNAGAVVRDGKDGFIVPIRDVKTIVDRLDLLARNPGLRSQLGASARARAAEFTIERYGQRLIAALEVLGQNQLAGALT